MSKEPRVKWLSEVDSTAARDIYANIPPPDLVAVDVKTGIVYTGEMFHKSCCFKTSVRNHLNCDEFSPRAKADAARRKMLGV